MKPFIFEYAEIPSNDSNISLMVEYSKEFNLNVLKDSNQPAINHVSLDTETFTKANVDTSTEGDDNYKLILHRFLDTELETRSSTDTTESDEQNKNLLSIIDINRNS